MAGMNLGALHALQGDTRRAVEAFAVAADRGTGEFSQESERRLRILLPQLRGADLVAELTASTAIDLPPSAEQRAEAYRLLDDISTLLWEEGDHVSALSVGGNSLAALGPASRIGGAELRLALATALRLAQWRERSDTRAAYQAYRAVQIYADELRNRESDSADGPYYLAISQRRSAMLAWALDAAAELFLNAFGYASLALKLAPERVDVAEEAAASALHLYSVSNGLVSRPALHHLRERLAQLHAAGRLSPRGESLLDGLHRIAAP